MFLNLHAIAARLRELFRPRARFTAEQDEEFAFHLEMETAENVRRGMSEAEARRVALLRFGGRQRFREETSDARGIVAVDNLARDARFALRRLRRAPGFAVGVIATLGLGIGAAVGIGTIVYDVLLRELPYHKSEQLVRIGVATDGLATTGDLLSAATYFHFAKSARSFAELGASYTRDDFSITDGNAPERVTIASVTPSMLTLLGVRPLLGQLFETADSSWSNKRTAILISENLWRRRYGADPSILGRSIDINRGARVVVGVLPRSFQYPSPSVDIYYPAPIPVKQPVLAAGYLNLIGRLRDGVTAASAQAELNALLSRISERFPSITPEELRQSRPRARVESLRTATVAAVRPQLELLGMLVAIVLLIATTNVINLFLLRTERASQEIAIALSLGASRVAIAQRFVIEGIVLGLCSTAVALPAAALALSTKFGFTEREIPRLEDVSFGWETAAIVVGCAVAIGAAVGLISLTRSQMGEVFDKLRATRSTSSRGWRHVQNGLVVFQLAIALVLLVAAGLLGRSFWNLHSADIGFEPANAMTFQVSLPWNGYTSYGAQVAFHAKLADRLAALPGVTSVGVTLHLPLASRGEPDLGVQLQADDGSGRPAALAAGNLASADYFRTMQIPLVAGRTFRAGDLRGAPAAVLSERLAKSVFGTTNVVGRRIIARLYAGSAPTLLTVVGVSGDVPWSRIEDGTVPMVYVPLLHDGDGLPADSNPTRYSPTEVQFTLRGTHLPSAATIQDILKTLDGRVPAAGVRTLGSIVEDATARVRLTMLLIVIAGAAALLLGVIGVYSVVSYAADGRMREFGIRLALGASPARVGRMVSADGVKLVGIGTGVGLIAAFGAAKFLRALLYEVTPTSPATFAVAAVVLVGVTLFATLVPARRAARTHLAVILRSD